ncbi:hypothetical protein [Gemmata sp.]|uniref:hypothetical protein n=1 Tax=Gemmata sp. TaxID=1914242 RepID=UPI003F6EB039
MLNVHLRINDGRTGRPAPARVRVTSETGAHFAPLGRCAEFPIGRNEVVGGWVKLPGGERWFYTDGSCEIPLPAGVPLRIQATRGPNAVPLDETVTLGAGQISLRFTLEAWAGAAGDGWVSLDTRGHFLAPHDALLEAAAEGLGVVNLLATEQPYPSLDGTAYPTVPNLTAFSGQAAALERDGTAVVVNTLNTHPVLGKVALLNSHRPVFPLAFGGEESDDWGICDWCDQCHRKGGLVVWVDAFEPACGVNGGESLVAAVLGKIDAIELSPGTRKVPLLPWVYRLWDAGVRVPLVGGSGKDSNRTPLGATRTVAKVPAGSNWVEAVRSGGAFATTGPHLDFAVTDTECRAAARSRTPFEELAIVANGRPVASTKAESSADGYRAELTGPPPESGWVAARCLSAAGAFAHTPPVAVGPVVRDPEAVAALRKLIEQTRMWAEEHGRYANPTRREQIFARCAEAAAALGAGA